MKAAAKQREFLRPHGRIAPGCRTCLHLADCGGFQPERTLFTQNCVQANCCRDHFAANQRNLPPCDNVCPNNPDYLDYLREVGGLSFANVAKITQRPVELPLYIPLVYRRYAQKTSVAWPTVALSTYEVVKVKRGRMGAVASTPESLRRAFGLSDDSVVVLRGVASDRPLERYWTYRRRDRIPELLASLGITMAVGPNFSHFLDVPRHDNLFNRKRQLLCLEEFDEAGINAAPHLNAAQPGDWQFWGRYLAQNPTVNMVAIEFETGNWNRSEGERAIVELVRLQQSVGRRLHPMIIGGSQFLEHLASEFDSASFMDSTPFMKTVYRQALVGLFSSGKGAWCKSPTAPGESLSNLLAQNLRRYSAWISHRWLSVTTKN